MRTPTGKSWTPQIAMFLRSIWLERASRTQPHYTWVLLERRNKENTPRKNWTMSTFCICRGNISRAYRRRRKKCAVHQTTKTLRRKGIINCNVLAYDPWGYRIKRISFNRRSSRDSCFHCTTINSFVSIEYMVCLCMWHNQQPNAEFHISRFIPVCDGKIEFVAVCMQHDAIISL